ncbi:hypothetical protein [Arthrobacter sp. PAMC25564]|uniref:hypothetical protein n=1 Tax=Arthrobacter sp. PAMC25564 TaxID=2565366 RepID=UPI00197B0F9E|nr:hypothetical protein [Arthrobacter sp. PAMC25564]
MLRVVQDRYVGDTKLNDSVSIVALMNPIETTVDAYDLPAPMANRMMHLKWASPVTVNCSARRQSTWPSARRLQARRGFLHLRCKPQKHYAGVHPAGVAFQHPRG